MMKTRGVSRSIASILVSWGVASWGVIAVATVAFMPSQASADPPVAPAPAACGTTDNPCPLQKWMRANMGASLAANDTDALGKALDHAAGLVPDPSWAQWTQIAKAGSAAAASKDMAGVKASCKSCHDAFKDKYKSQFRARAVN